jgi:hypothetical protein
LNERWLRAWFEKDAAVIERLAADDYVYIGPTGIVLDRQAILRIIRSPGYRLDHGQRSDVIIRPLGADAAIVRHRWRGTGSFDGKPFTDDQRGVAVWQRRDGIWQIVLEQCCFASVDAASSFAAKAAEDAKDAEKE